MNQLVLGYPASNVVLEPDAVPLHGRTSYAPTRVMRGTESWPSG